MEVAQKVMIACLLMSEGADDKTLAEFISVLEAGIEAGEGDSIALFNELMARMDGPLPEGYVGEVIGLMKAKMKLDESCRKFGLAISGMEKVLKILDGKPKNDFAAKIMMQRALSAIEQAKADLV